MKIIIIGANGQVGKHLLSKFKSNGNHEVFGLCRSLEGAFLIKHITDNIIIGNVEEEEECLNILKDFDVIINSAVAGGNVVNLLNTNIKICENLALLGKKHPSKIIIHFSTLMIYNNLLEFDEKLFKEPKPASFYGYTKLKSENSFLSLSKQASSKYYVLRLGHVYGPSLMQSNVTIDSITNKYYSLPFDGSKISNCIHIEFLFQGILSLINSNDDSGIYNAVNYPNQTWRQIFNWHSVAAGLPLVKNSPEYRDTEIENTFSNRINSSKIKKVLYSIKNVFSTIPMTLGKSLGDISSFVLAFLGLNVFKKIKSKFVLGKFTEAIRKSKEITEDEYFVSTVSVPGKILVPQLLKSDDLENSIYLEEMNSWYIQSQELKSNHLL
jgi:nucleoside-diphosphate-sugar epimerase